MRFVLIVGFIFTLATATIPQTIMRIFTDEQPLIEMGADGIMTDYPHRLAEVYAEYNK